MPARRIAALYRSLLLAPFGGEPGLFEGARRRCAVGAAAGVYDADTALSTEGRPLRIAEHGLVSFLFSGDPAERRHALERRIGQLADGEALLVLDHNAPRRALLRWLATGFLFLGRPLLRGPVGKRLRHPVARELQDLGLEVVRLRLLGGELFQAVVARKPVR